VGAPEVAFAAPGALRILQARSPGFRIARGAGRCNVLSCRVWITAGKMPDFRPGDGLARGKTGDSPYIEAKASRK